MNLNLTTLKKGVGKVKLFNHHIIRIELAPCPLRYKVVIVPGGGKGRGGQLICQPPRGYPNRAAGGSCPPPLPVTC